MQTAAARFYLEKSKAKGATFFPNSVAFFFQLHNNLDWLLPTLPHSPSQMFPWLPLRTANLQRSNFHKEVFEVPQFLDISATQEKLFLTASALLRNN